MERACAPLRINARQSENLRRFVVSGGKSSMVQYRAMRDRLRNWARVMKRDVHALHLAGRDPRVPWYAKALALVVAGYALSPIDLIPDFIPVLGYLDDVILVPFGVWLVIQLIPPDIMAEHRELATAAQNRPVSRSAAFVVSIIWVASIVVAGWLVYRNCCF
jgi:uncharacterized membrane protein YkvA (DUF1232 family)